jgi:hypothetical protein
LCIDAITLSPHAAAQRSVCDCLRVILDRAINSEAFTAISQLVSILKLFKLQHLYALQALLSIANIGHPQATGFSPIFLNKPVDKPE